MNLIPDQINNFTTSVDEASVRPNHIRGENAWLFPAARRVAQAPYTPRQMFKLVRLVTDPPAIRGETGRQEGRFGMRRQGAVAGTWDTRDAKTDEVLVRAPTSRSAAHTRTRFDARIDGTYYNIISDTETNGYPYRLQYNFLQEMSVKTPNIATPVHFIKQFVMIRQNAGGGFQLRDSLVGCVIVNEHPSVACDFMSLHERTNADTVSLRTYLGMKTRAHALREKTHPARFLGRAELYELFAQLVLCFVAARQNERHKRDQIAMRIGTDNLFVVTPDRGRASRTAVAYNLRLRRNGREEPVVLSVTGGGVRKLLYIDDPTGPDPKLAWRYTDETRHPLGVGYNDRLYEIYRDVSAMLLGVKRESEAEIHNGVRDHSFDLYAKLSFDEEQGYDREMLSDLFFDKPETIDVMKKYIDWFAFGAFIGVFGTAFSPALRSQREKDSGQLDHLNGEISASEHAGMRGAAKTFQVNGEAREKRPTVRGEIGAAYRAGARFRGANGANAAHTPEGMLSHPLLSLEKRLAAVFSNMETAIVDDDFCNAL